MIQNYNLKLGISLGNLHLLIRLLAEEAFNTTCSLADKLRMFIIHIRSPCKLFYQVSLNFNIKDSSSDELEVDKLDFNRITTIKSKKESIPQDTSKKVIRNRYLSTSPDVLLFLKKEKSPKNQYGLSDQRMNQTIKLNFTGRTATQSKISPEKSKSKDKTTDIIKIKLENFKTKHQDILKSEATSKTSKKIQMRNEYAYNLRNKLFSSLFVKKIIFTAWKGECSKIL